MADQVGELWRVEIGTLTFGFWSINGKVAEAAPVARWMEGKPLDDVLAHYRRRGGRAEVCVRVTNKEKRRA